MKKLVLAALLISFAICMVQAQTKTSVAPDLNQSSSLAEILDWLNKNAFPKARVGLRSKGYTVQPVSPWQSENSVPGHERIFSEGFHVKQVDGCHLILSNEHVAIIDSRTPSSGAFSRFIAQEKGKREVKPQLALLFLRLDRMSDRRGKGPYVHTKDQEKANLLGPWRTSFEQKGFFSRVIFEMELIAAEQPQTKELGRFHYLTFTFDSKELAEQFNTMFRRAITICGSK